MMVALLGHGRVVDWLYRKVRMYLRITPGRMLALSLVSDSYLATAVISKVET